MKDFRVLVVDDEIDFLETIVRRLRKRHLDCRGVDNETAAIELISQGDIDVVLLDVKMGDVNGIDILREIKRIKPLIEVVMLTGHASVESGIEGMKLGAFDYLMKPMEFDMLIEKLTDAYEKKAIHEAKIKKTESGKHLSGGKG